MDRVLDLVLVMTLIVSWGDPTSQFMPNVLRNYS